MKKLLAVSILGFAITLDSFAAPTSAEQLRSEFEAALKTGDTNTILSLCNWDGVSNKTNSYLHMAIDGWTKFRSKFQTNQIRAVVWLRPLSDNEEMEGIVNGIRYRPNVSVIGWIEGSLGVNDNGTNTSQGAIFYYGKKDGHFYFAGTIAEKIYEPKVKEKRFIISITSTNFSTATPYAISYVYLQNDQEITKTFTGTNSLQRLVWGNELKSCVLRKLSDDNNLLELQIREMSTNKNLTLLDSKTSSTNAPIIYKIKPL